MNIIGEYTTNNLNPPESNKRKKSDVSLVLMTDVSPNSIENEEVKAVNNSYTEPVSSTKIGFDNEY